MQEEELDTAPVGHAVEHVLAPQEDAGDVYVGGPPIGCREHRISSMDDTQWHGEFTFVQVPRDTVILH